MKTRVLPLAVGVAILGCVLAVSANVTTSKIHENLDRERHVRLETEKQLQSAIMRIRTLQSQMAESQKKFENIQAILNQGRTVTNDLQLRLDEVIREKEVLAQKMTELQNQATDDNAQISR